MNRLDNHPTSQPLQIENLLLIQVSFEQVSSSIYFRVASEFVEGPIVRRAPASVGRIEATANAYPAAGNVMGAHGQTHWN